MTSYQNLTIKNWAVEDRPREKMLVSGTQTLSDAELIAIIIGSGTKNLSAVDLGRQILHMAGNSLDKLGRYSVSDLKKLKGIGQARAVMIVAALELGRRRNASESPDATKIMGSSDIFREMVGLLCDLQHEEFWVVYLNRSNKVIHKTKISQGGITGTVTDIRLILKTALDVLATSIVICHNHPSGNLQPSEADISITRKLKESSGLMDINLLDHIIVAGKAYYSFADEGLL